MSHNEQCPPSYVNYDSTEDDLGVLMRELRKKNAIIEELTEQKTQLILEKERAHSLINDILNSRSWKLTAFLRHIKALIVSTFPLLRFGTYKYETHAAEHIELQHGIYTPTGSSPQLTLTTNNAKCPFGWVTVTTDFACDKGQMFFLLYYGSGTGLSGDRRLWLNLEAQHNTIGPIWIPPGTTQLRIDPFDQESSLSTFRLSHIEFKPLGSVQILWLTLTKHIKPVLHDPKLLAMRFSKAISLFRSGGIPAIKQRLFSDGITSNYQDWIRRYDTISDSDREKIKKHIIGLTIKPKISIIMPTYKTPITLLDKAIESVRSQLYENWELCIADDNSCNPELTAALNKYVTLDNRIKVVHRKINGHIGAASNTALEMATGDFVGFLDHDDELREHALYLIVDELNKHPDTCFFYTDEDKINEQGYRFNPYFKPDWNPELLLTQNYICHFVVCQRALITKAGAFRDGFDGAQDWDLILRATHGLPQTQIRHIPFIAYHWRVVTGSTAAGLVHKPYVLDAQKKAIQDHLVRNNKKGEVEIRKDIAHLRVKFNLPTPEPKLTIIIPTKDLSGMLGKCVDSILEKTIYNNYEILIIDNNSNEQSTFNLFAEYSRNSKIRVHRDESPFNYAELNNKAVALCNTEFVCFLNNDIEVISPYWLNELVSYAQFPDIGAVGARLLYPNGTLQHGGVVTGIGGVAGHSHKGRRREDPGYFNIAILPHAVSGVTAACLVIKRSIFNEVGGFDQKNLTVAFNDVDFCLRVKEHGYRNVYTGYAELTHYESISRGYETTPEKVARFERESAYMKKRWGNILSCDPYYNPNLSLLTEDYAFAYPPRTKKPWLA